MKLRFADFRWLWLGLLWLALPLADASSGPATWPADTLSPVAIPRPYLYTGEQIDPDLGMYYLRARYYQPAIGRFWTIDSYEGRIRIPVSQHKFIYCHSDPVNGLDPSGHMNIQVNMASMSMAMGGIGQLASRVNVQNTIGRATYIYRSVENGVVRYVGITYNFSARAATHLREKGIQVTKLFEEGLSREEARAVEQVLIELHGLSGNGSLMNQINSIAASNPIYAESIRRGTEILRAIGYPGL